MLISLRTKQNTCSIDNEWSTAEYYQPLNIVGLIALEGPKNIAIALFTGTGWLLPYFKSSIRNQCSTFDIAHLLTAESEWEEVNGFVHKHFE
jgi:hypothetical protein